MPNNASEINAKKVISHVALESVVFYRQKKNSHQFNDLLCCQRILPLLNAKEIYRVSIFLTKARKYKRHESTREQHNSISGHLYIHVILPA